MFDTTFSQNTGPDQPHLVTTLTTTRISTRVYVINMNQQVKFQRTMATYFSVSSLNLDALSLNDRRDTSSPSLDFNSGGWGSTETRKAYVSLDALVVEANGNGRRGSTSSTSSSSSSSSTTPQQQPQSQGQQWDFFVEDDAMDMDEGNFW